MNRAKEAAARSWRSTLSSGDGHEEDKDTPPSQDPQPQPESKETDRPRPPPPQQHQPYGDGMLVKPVMDADREKLVEDFQQRRKAAAANRHRGNAQWLGAANSPRPLPKAPDQSGWPLYTSEGENIIILHFQLTLFLSKGRYLGIKQKR